MNKKVTLLFLLALLFQGRMLAQQVVHHTFQLSWSEEQPLKFDGAGEYVPNPALPVYTFRFPLERTSQIIPDVIVEASEVVEITDPDIQAAIPGQLYVGAVTEQERGRWYGRVWFMPFVKTTGSVISRVSRGTIMLRIVPQDDTSVSRNGPPFKETSVLATGTVHKISVSQNGVYKIDYDFIKDKLKIEPSSIDPDKIGVFGNGAGRIPQWNNAPRIDDLEQTASMGVGLDDGQFNPGDYLLWYGEGPDAWRYDAPSRTYDMDKNIYDEKNHYYIILNGPSRLHMESRSNGMAGTYTSDKSLVYQRLEEEKVNLLGRYRPPGSGQEWYGDEMAVVNQLDYSNRFNLTDLVPADTFHYKVRFAARSGLLSQFDVRFGQKEFSRNVGGVDLVNYESSFAKDAVLQGAFVPGTSVQEITVRYPSANGVNARAWVDYIQLNHWNRNTYRPGQPLSVQDPRQLYLGIPEYTIDAFPGGGQVWDITDPILPIAQQYNTGVKTTFVAPAGGQVPNAFICFNPAQDVLIPEYVGAVTPQNLHSLQRADMLIIYYDEFETAAMKLADHRRNFSGLDVAAIPVSQVFEEFGGGSKDPSAVRDFARMMYNRDPLFEYLLLLGDATYDFLNRFPEIPYHHYVPAFETEESLDPIRSFPSDDYFALLDDDEGDNLIGAIDIAVGRMPVSSADEAVALVDKIIYYDSHPSTLDDWRMRVVMVADDEDSNVHLNQADNLAVNQNLEHPELNIHKIYLDAYPQETTPGGDRYPAVNADIDLNMKKGALTVTYLGHGGQNGWTQERVLGINQAQSYDNIDNMPLFITATCSFAGYDEPGFTTAGEHLLTNPDGGAIALMTTVRAVYSGSNERLTRAVLRRIYDADTPGDYPSIAEVLRRAKNDNALDTLDTNARKFTLLGDPSMKLAHPRYSVAVTEIQGVPVDAGIPDTLSALEPSTISGVILDDQEEILASFNGQIIVTLFDKPQVRKTLANDEGSSVRAFTTQTRQLFKGSASVVDGHWTIDFVMPKDIDFSFGAGKISMYANTDAVDAAGYFNALIIGGVSEEGLTDDTPPVIQLYMNNENFVSGGITDPDPDIYMILSDDNGINVTGTSIGHDIEAILDNDDRNSIILNDFYQAFLDDYTRGEVRYPLKDLAAGKHTLKVTAWDLANNPAEAFLEFIVVPDEGAVIEHLSNYPNPFSESTYFQFEHNLPDATMELEIRVFDLNGRLVKTIEKEAFVPGGYRVEGIEWKGDNDAGAALPSGMYMYHMTLTYLNSGNTAVRTVDAEKLVIIR